MIDNTAPPTVSPRTARSFPVAAIVGGVVLVAAIGAAAGWVGHSAHTDAANPPPVAAATDPNALASNATPAPTYANNGNAPVYTPPAQAPAATTATGTNYALTPPNVAPQPAPYGTVNGSGTYGATGNAPAPATRVAQAPCGNCGVIEAVNAFQVKPAQGSGVGAVGGGVLGGVLGHQFGGGTGRGVMTALGVVGGAVAGNEVEKRMHTTTEYSVKVRMDDGHYRTFTQKSAPAQGSRVVVEGHSMRIVSSHYREGSGNGA